MHAWKKEGGRREAGHGTCTPHTSATMTGDICSVLGGIMPRPPPPPALLPAAPRYLLAVPAPTCAGLLCLRRCLAFLRASSIFSCLSAHCCLSALPNTLSITTPPPSALSRHSILWLWQRGGASAGRRIALRRGMVVDMVRREQRLSAPSPSGCEGVDRTRSTSTTCLLHLLH